MRGRPASRDGADPETLMTRADRALYGRRNRPERVPPPFPVRVSGRGTNLAVRSLVEPAKRVLAIDDDADFREGLSDVLEERGYRVRAVSNGREALEELRREPAPDVILLDLRMPEMDGRTFRRELSRDERLARIPLVVISGSREVEGEAASIGAAAVLPKPFGVDALLKSIETVTGH